MARKPNLKAAITTRDHILSAAMVKFARQTYDSTGLREIAADAEVDVAYVHRCFGSKRQLFREVVNRAFELERIFDGPPQNLATELTKKVFAPAGAVLAADVEPLDIVIRSLSCPEAVEILQECTERDLIEPMTENLETPNARQAALVAAFVAGLRLLRSVIAVEELCDSRGGHLEAMVKEALSTMTSKDFLQRCKARAKGRSR